MRFAAFGWLTPVAGALTQEAIDVAVILNALRALTPAGVRTWPMPRRRPRVAPGPRDLDANSIACGRSPMRWTMRPAAAVSLIGRPTGLTAIVEHEHDDESRVYPRLAKSCGVRPRRHEPRPS